MKNRGKTMNMEDKIDVISQFEKGKQIVDTCQMLDSLIVAYVVIMLIVLQIVLRQELQCFVARLPHSYQNKPYQTVDVS